LYYGALSDLQRALISGTISVMRKTKSLSDGYAFPGFRPLRRVKGRFGDRFARVVVLKRRGKKLAAEPAVRSVGPITTAGGEEFVTSPVGLSASTWSWRSAVSIAATAAR